MIKNIISIKIFVTLCIIIVFYSDYNVATGTGNLAILLFIAANIYSPTKLLRQIFRFRNVQKQFEKMLHYHIFLNTSAFIVACIHAYVVLWVNDWLRLSLIIMGWLTIGGFVMFIKLPPSRFKKGLYLLHTQQVLFFTLIFALLKGHYVI